MKKSLLLVCFLAYILHVQAQTLYGLTHNGGNDGAGALIKFTPATNNLTVAKSFEIYAAYPYYTNFIQASDGKLYGMTSGGGNVLYDGYHGDGYGVIFSFDPSTSTYTMLKAFDGTNGRNPYGSLLQARDGKLYGMTFGGGSSDVGVIFSFDPSTSTYTKLKDFDDTNGSYPYGSLVQANDGKLYGMTYSGGGNGYGVIFSFDPSSTTYTKLKDFDGVNGSTPYGSLVQASDGKLYGMTTLGGSSDYGIIFSFDPASATYTKLKDFDYTNGANPWGSLMQASDGKLYGMTRGGGSGFGYGVIFSFDLASSTYTKVKDFGDGNANGGAYPTGSLMQATDGKFYGMMNNAIFSFDPSTSTYTKLMNFDRDKGSIPYGSLMQANNGKLYGMTNQGGSPNFATSGSYDEGRGVIFSFDLASSTYTKLMNLDANNGGHPSGALLKASNGKLYGMTHDGGSNAGGIIFSFDPSTSIYTKLIDFDGTNGAHPYGSLIQAGDGKLYGMTTYGGIESWGVLFSFNPSTSTFTKLKDFAFDGSNVINPNGSLMQASDGKLYGVSGNGANTTIFSFDPSSSNYNQTTIIHDPYGGSTMAYGNLVQASNGKLYGTYLGDGSNTGNLFSFDLSTSTYSRLKDFVSSNTDGYYPSGSLMQAGDGKLYGMTTYTGSGGDSNSNYGNGVIFSFDPNSSTYIKLKDFESSDGNPHGSLMQAGDGKLYGMSHDWRCSGMGFIFSFDPLSSTYTKLKDFSENNDVISSYYYMGSAFIEVSGTLAVTLISFTGENNGGINQLSWKVENEQDLNYYELQRGIDGQHFSSISQIKAAGNNSYAYNDHIAAVSSVYYYRLKSVDKDGNFKYSGIIKINVANANATQIAVAPNPFSNSTTISFSLPQPEKVSIRIYDMMGRLIKTLTDAQMQAGTHQLIWNAKDEKGCAVIAGIYLLKMQTGNYTETKKLVVVK